MSLLTLFLPNLGMGAGDADSPFRVEAQEFHVAGAEVTEVHAAGPVASEVHAAVAETTQVSM